MSRHSLNDAEQGFLDALLDEAAVKIAVDLDPETAKVLGAKAVSPNTLKELERSAGQATGAPEPGQATGAPEPASAPATTQAAPPPEATPAPEAQPAPAAPQPAGRPPLGPQQVTDFRDELPSPIQLDVPAEVKGEPDVPVEVEDEEEELAEPAVPLRAIGGGAFSNKKAHPLALFDLLNAAYDQAWPDWESETLYWGIRRTYGSIGELNRNKVMALRLAASTDVPWLDWDVFEDCGLAWNNIVPTIGAFQPMTPMQAAFTLHCLREIRHIEKPGHEVLAYIAAILDEHGWVYAPAEFYGRVDEILQRNQPNIAFRSDVKLTWSKVRGMEPESISFDEQNPLDVHIVKIFVVQRYLAELEETRAGSLRPGATGVSAPPIPRTS